MPPGPGIVRRFIERVASIAFGVDACFCRQHRDRGRVIHRCLIVGLVVAFFISSPSRGFVWQVVLGIVHGSDCTQLAVASSPMLHHAYIRYSSDAASFVSLRRWRCLRFCANDDFHAPTYRCVHASDNLTILIHLALADAAVPTFRPTGDVNVGNGSWKSNGTV